MFRIEKTENKSGQIAYFVNHGRDAFLVSVEEMNEALSSAGLIKSPNSKRYELEQRKTEALEDANRLKAIEFVFDAETQEEAHRRKRLLVNSGLLTEED